MVHIHATAGEDFLSFQQERIPVPSGWHAYKDNFSGAIGCIYTYACLLIHLRLVEA